MDDVQTAAGYSSRHYTVNETLEMAACRDKTNRESYSDSSISVLKTWSLTLIGHSYWPLQLYTASSVVLNQLWEFILTLCWLSFCLKFVSKTTRELYSNQSIHSQKWLWFNTCVWWCSCVAVQHQVSFKAYFHSVSSIFNTWLTPENQLWECCVNCLSLLPFSDHD